MARFLVFLDGLPSAIERKDVFREAAAEDCHSRKGYSVVTSQLSADSLAQTIVQEAIRRGAREAQLRVVVVRFDHVAARGVKQAIEDCF